MWKRSPGEVEGGGGGRGARRRWPTVSANLESDAKLTCPIWLGRNPATRSLELHRRLLKWVTARSAAIVDGRGGPHPPILRAVLPNIDRDTVHQEVLEAEGFQPVRWAYRMLRDLGRAVVAPPCQAAKTCGQCPKRTTGR